MTTMNIKLRQTHARMFRACEMKYNLAVNQGLIPIDKRPALSIGTICHAGRAKFLQTFDKDQMIAAMIASIQTECKLYPTIADREPTLNKDGKTHSADCKCVLCISEICIKTMDGYADEFSKRFPMGDLAVHAIEQQFEFEICSYEDMQLTWTGTVDADISMSGRRLNFEFKTTSERDLDSYIDHEEMSLQHVVYPYHLQKIKGHEYFGTMLDVAKKGTKNLPPSFAYRSIQKTQRDYEQFEWDAYQLLKRLAYNIELDYWPKNADACKTRYGLCEYWRLCYTNFARYEMQKFATVDFPLAIQVEDEETNNG